MLLTVTTALSKLVIATVDFYLRFLCCCRLQVVEFDLVGGCDGRIHGDWFFILHRLTSWPDTNRVIIRGNLGNRILSLTHLLYLLAKITAPAVTVISDLVCHWKRVL